MNFVYTPVIITFLSNNLKVAKIKKKTKLIKCFGLKVLKKTIQMNLNSMVDGFSHLPVPASNGPIQLARFDCRPTDRQTTESIVETLKNSIEIIRLIK